ncbi:MAG: hypothetical protein PHD30_00100 [Paludibacter sp.]|nr:hypothetical protein [Paludibacter sp.]
MRNLILLILFVLVPSAYAQDIFLNMDNPVQKKLKNVKINLFLSGINISPIISWLNVNHDDLQTDGATITA